MVDRGAFIGIGPKGLLESENEYGNRYDNMIIDMTIDMII